MANADYDSSCRLFIDDALSRGIWEAPWDELASWRGRRLTRVICHACGFLNLDPTELIRYVRSVEDSEGNLTVVWRVPVPTCFQFAFANAWESAGDEAIVNVSHEVR